MDPVSEDEGPASEAESSDPKLKTPPADAPVHLSAASFSASPALYIDLKTENIKNIRTLIDPSASDCFIDSRFALDSQHPIPSLISRLRLGSPF